MPDTPENLENKNPQEPEAEKPEYRQISDDELKQILADHEKWLASDGKEGKQADLSRCNLSGRLLKYINLPNANFHYADLSDAHLIHSNLGEGNFQNANLFGAKLQNADFFSANLINAAFDEANLSQTDFDFSEMACCSFRGCNLKDVKGLDGTKLAQADITNAKLDDKVSEFKALVTVEEASRNAKKIFFSMLLACVYSWLTIGSTTDVALLTNSSSSNLPIIQTGVPIAAFYLAAPFLLMVLYIYLHLYLRRLWQALASLPAIFEDGKPLDERAYPWILNGLVRRHFIRLKGKYKEITKEENESAIKWYIRKTFLWLWYRIKGTRPFMARLEEWVSILLAWWLVPLTLTCFWFRYLTRHDWDGTIMQAVLIAVTVLFGIIFYRVHAHTLAGVMFKRISALNYLKWILSCFLAVLLVFCSYGGIEGKRWWNTALNLDGPFDNPLSANIFPAILSESFGYDIFADFENVHVSTMPDNYWLIDASYRDQAVKGADLEGANIRNANAIRAFLLNADLHKADLRDAILFGANMQNANLDSANLSRAVLSDANMTNCNFQNAIMIETRFFLTNMANANFRRADMTSVYISDCDMDGIKLLGANMTKAQIINIKLINSDFRMINLKEAHLTEVKLNGADLSGAMLEGASFTLCDLGGIKLKDANLSKADLYCAILIKANMTGSNLIGAQISRADLSNANLAGADLTDADFLGTNLKNANLCGAKIERAHWLTQEQLNQAFGDSATILPPGLTIPIK